MSMVESEADTYNILSPTLDITEDEDSSESEDVLVEEIEPPSPNMFNNLNEDFPSQLDPKNQIIPADVNKDLGLVDFNLTPDPHISQVPNPKIEESKTISQIPEKSSIEPS